MQKQNHKLLLVLFLTSFAFTALPALAANPQVVAGTASGQPGGNVGLPVSFVPGTTGVSALQFDLALPNGMSFVSIASGSAAQAAQKDAYAAFNSGTITALIGGINQNLIGNGTLANITISLAANIAPGQYVITPTGLVFSDPNGNEVPESGVAGSITVSNSSDNIPPTTSITAPINGATVSSTITISANASDNVGVAKVELYIDNALFGTDLNSPYTFSWNTTSSANGSHTLQAKAYDAAGNVGTSTIVNVTVNNPDTQPPTVPTGLTVTGVTTSSISLAWSPSSDNVGVTGYKIYRCTGICAPNTQIGTAAGTSYVDTSLAASTTYSYAVAAYDNAGNTSAQSSAVQGTTQGTLGNGCYNIGGAWQAIAFTTQSNNTFTLTFNATPGSSGMDAVTGVSTNLAAQYTDLAAIVRFNSSNDIDVMNSSTYQSQTTMPYTPGTLYYVTMTVNVPAKTYSVSVDPQGGTTSTLATNYQFRNTQSGANSFSYLNGFDDVGTHMICNVAVAGQQDTTPPTISITAPINGATVSSTVSVSANASDNIGVTKVEFYLDGTLEQTDLNSPYTWSWNTTGVSNGSHTLSAKAYDAAGNIGISSNVAVTVSNPDTQAPTVPTGLGIAGTTTSTISLSWTASNDNVGVAGYKIFRCTGACSPNTQVGTSTTTSFTSSGLAASTTYSYAVSAYDAAGNTSALSSAIQGTTKPAGGGGDTTPPAVAITNPTNNQTVSGVITIQGGASDNVFVSSVQVSIDSGSYASASGTTSWTYQLDTTALANGNHTVTAKATDSSGNTNTTSIVINVQNQSGGDGGSGGGGGGGGGGGNGSGGSSGSGSGGAGNGGGTGGQSGTGGTSTSTLSTTPNGLEALLQLLLSELQALIQQLNTQLVSTFTRNLTIGSYGPDVKNLQLFLNDNGYTIAASGAGSPGNESQYLGAKTAAALAKWQTANGITPASGFLGPKTRAYMQSKW